MAKNLIIGVATGPEYLQTALPFAISARLYHPDDRIVLYCDADINPELQRDMTRLGVELYTATSNDAHDAQFHIQNRRYREYLGYLINHPCDRIFLSDTRDLFFQSNIFNGFVAHDNLAVFFEESTQYTIGTQEFNRNWVQYAYGDAGLQEIADYHVICSGTTLGTYGAIMSYLSYMVAFMEQKQLLKQVCGLDQGHHNYLIRKGFFPFPFLIFPQQNALVYTATGSDECHVTDFDKTGDINLITPSGFVPAAVHQYDRLDGEKNTEIKMSILTKLQHISFKAGLSQWPSRGIGPGWSNTHR